MFTALGGLLELGRLAIVSRGRLRGLYWSWRLETALGKDRGQWPSSGKRVMAFLRFGAWARSMRKLSK